VGDEEWDGAWVYGDGVEWAKKRGEGSLCLGANDGGITTIEVWEIVLE